ncbi:membrane hypothetical protein [uncultured delta proteobacterium]|uniref:Uncharacterized protein n=1 Tax=uncultured delta proteobacterium TaxID=34034 RepID=A0A212IUM5_9DELT|nr:membrane hypothetical protein [uncultured delta proteobacterium]
MTRFLCIALQLVALALSGLAVAVFSVPLTPEGLVGTPSRMQAGVFLLATMPLDGMAYLQALNLLVWVPVVTAGLGYLHGIARLRLFGLIGAGVNAAALGYLYYMVPAVASPKGLAWPILGTALLFAGSAVCMLTLGRRTGGKGVRGPAVFVLLLLWLGSVGILGWGVWGKVLSAASLAGIAGTVLGLTLAFYCLARAIKSAGAKKGGSGAVFLLLPLLLCAACAYYSPPLALPLGAGILVFLAACLP